MPSNYSAHFAAVFARSGESWTGAEIDIRGVGTVDDVTELISEAVGTEDLTILCLEADDEWFAIMRLDRDEEPRIFVSDVLPTDPLCVLFTEFAGVQPEDADPGMGVSPVGDLDLLEDLGVSPAELLELCMEEGVLPGETMSVLAERLGFADELDRLR